MNLFGVRPLHGANVIRPKLVLGLRKMGNSQNKNRIHICVFEII